MRSAERPRSRRFCWARWASSSGRGTPFSMGASTFFPCRAMKGRRAAACETVAMCEARLRVAGSIPPVMTNRLAARRPRVRSRWVPCTVTKTLRHPAKRAAAAAWKPSLPRPRTWTKSGAMAPRVVAHSRILRRSIDPVELVCVNGTKSNLSARLESRTRCNAVCGPPVPGAPKLCWTTTGLATRISPVTSTFPAKDHRIGRLICHLFRSVSVDPATPSGTAVLFIGGELPHGDATANRAVSLAKALREDGWSPVLLSEYASDRSHDARGIVDGIPYANVGPAQGSRVMRLAERFRRQKRVADALTSLGKPSSDVGLLIVHATLYGRLLQRWADRKQIPLVADLMERHEPAQFARGKWDPRYLRHRRLSRLCARRPAGLLLISNPLKSMLRPRVPALVMPPFVDTREVLPHRNLFVDRVDHIYLAYAGTPNNKDLLGPVVDAIAALEPRLRARVKLTIAGPTREGLLALGEVKESSLHSCGGSVEVVGRLSRTEVRRLWSASDLCVLVRPQTGYAVAGFPSKVPEAMAAGCALFGTAHGDLADFAHDGQDALLAASARYEDVNAALILALKMSRSELDSIRHAARQSAEDTLSVTAWAPRLGAFVEQLVSRNAKMGHDGVLGARPNPVR